MQQQQSVSSFNTLPVQSGGTNPSNYSYSMHKFKLIARAKLSTTDISEEVQTKNLQIIHETNLDRNQGSNSGSSNGNLNIQNQNNPGLTLNPSTNSSNSTTNKLPLFDFYSCCLCYAPTSTYI